MFLPRLRARVRLARLARRLRRRYGRNLSFEIHPNDLMYLWYLRDSVARARATYFSSGDRNTREFEVILEGLGRTLGPELSLLDFACGYGRVTRFLVAELGRDRVTVSDVEPAAVDFVVAALGASGFDPTRRAEDLDHEGRYDVILVASLFSHLPRREWEAWLAKLFGLLTERGVLVFSTQGTSLRVRNARRRGAGRGAHGHARLLLPAVQRDGGPARRGRLWPDLRRTTERSPPWSNRIRWAASWGSTRGRCGGGRTSTSSSGADLPGHR